MDQIRILFTVFKIVEQIKGENPIILDLQGITVITDYFLIANGQNTIHVKALADAVLKQMEEENITPQRVEGYREGRWVLLDYGFMVIHLLTKEARDFYHLEQLWHGAKILTPTLA
jgi:ribosome-associated protein